MARDSDFDAFADEARDLFGLDENQASDLLSSLEEEYAFDYEVDSLRAYGPEASDLIDFDEMYPDDDSNEELYDLDSEWPDDEYLDAGEWYELSAGYSDEEEA